jgi:hypothetical protein
MKTKISTTMIVFSISIFLAILYYYYSIEGFRGSRCSLARGRPGTRGYVAPVNCRTGFCDGATNTCKRRITPSGDRCQGNKDCRKPYEVCGDQTGRTRSTCMFSGGRSEIYEDV